MKNGNIQLGVSPEATGGAGTIDEYRFAAVNLVKLLRTDTLPGLPAPVAAVGLQRREAGNLLDDVVLQGSPQSDAMRVEYQVKRTMSPTKSNTAFVDSLKQCLHALEAHRDAVDAGVLRFGLATRPSGPVEQLRKLTEAARAHATLESFESIALTPGATDEDVRRRFEQVVDAVVEIQRDRGKLLETVDCRLLTFTLLRATQVWQFEVGQDGRDTTEAVNRLADILPPGDHSATAVFTQLVDIAETWGPKAGLISQAMLRAELERRGVALTVEPKQRAALTTLADATRRELDATSWKIAGRLELPREPTLQRIIDAVAANSFVLLSGQAGVGKSVLARRAVKELETTATTIVINLAGRGRESLADLQGELGADLATALPTAATTGRRVLLIDGAEHALVDNGRLLTAVLAAVPLDPVTAPAWTVVLTTRSEAASVICRHLPAAPVQVDISDADDDEIAAIVQEFPQLTPLTRNARSSRLLRRPYLVDLLIRADARLDDGPLGEEDVMDHVWDHVVRREEGARAGIGTPHARASACLALAEESARTATGSSLASADGDAIRGLVSDDLVVRDRTRYRFAHDVLLDYAMAMRLLDDDHQQLLSSVDELRRLIRAVRLTLQRRLANATEAASAEAIRQWNGAVQLAEDLAAQNGPRWRNLPYEALLSMGNPRPLLDALRPALLANDGAQLLRLLQVVRRFATTSTLEPNGDGLQLDVLLGAPVVDFLGVVGPDVPQRTTYIAADVVRRWLLAAARTGASCEDHLADPPGLTRAIALWAGNDSYGDRLKAALPSLAILGRHLTLEAQAVFDRLAERNDELSVIVEESDVATAAAAANPELLLLIAGRYYLDQSLTLDPAQTTPSARRKRRSRHRLWMGEDELEGGVRDHAPRFRRHDHAGLAAPHYGPFAALLSSSPQHGLRLIGAVVDVATVSRTAIERSFGHGDPTLTLRLARPGWNEPATYQGTAATWCWFRRTTVGAYPAMSALMALAEWALRQTQERPLGEVVDQVLGTSRSLAVVAVAVALLCAHLDVVTDELDPFLEQPLIWDLENSRHPHESSGLAYPLAGYNHLGRQPMQVVMTLVLRSDEAGRERLRAVGQRLIERTRDELTSAMGEIPADDHRELLVAESRARGLDASAYQITPSEAEGMVEIAVDLPKHVESGLQRSAAGASLNLAVASITTQAIEIRDGKSNASAAVLWERLADTLQQLDELDENDSPIYSASDALSAVASAVIMMAIEGGGSDADTQLVRDAIVAFLNAVENPSEQDAARHSSDRDTVWPMGADRSAATALPRLLAAVDLHAVFEDLVDRVEAAVKHLADSRSSDVRQRLVEAFDKALREPCRDDPSTHLHDLAVSALKQMILNCGIGPWQDGTRARTVLAEPLRDALGPGNDVLRIDEAADVLPGLAAAICLSCHHGIEVAEVMQALVDHDIVAWPEHYARKLYQGIDRWRAELDGYVAEQVLNGDQDTLERYLDAFAPVAEELRGLLVALAAHATTAERGTRLYERYWPLILDRLLPANRNFRTNGHRDYPHDRDVHDLDRALLPLPDTGQSWLPETLINILARWVQAFENCPHVVDHAIKSVAKFGLLGSPVGTALVLRVMGTDIERIQRESQMASAWLHVILVMDKDAGQQQMPQLLELLDRLAEAGDTTAIELQRELELQ